MQCKRSHRNEGSVPRVTKGKDEAGYAGNVVQLRKVFKLFLSETSERERERGGEEREEGKEGGERREKVTHTTHTHTNTHNTNTNMNTNMYNKPAALIHERIEVGWWARGDRDGHPSAEAGSLVSAPLHQSLAPTRAQLHRGRRTPAVAKRTVCAESSSSLTPA